jgi:hypothetical protein
MKNPSTQPGSGGFSSSAWIRWSQRYGRRSVMRWTCIGGVLIALACGHLATRSEHVREPVRDPLSRARTLRGRARRATADARAELTARAVMELERAWTDEFSPRDVGEATLSTAALCAAAGNFDTARCWLQRMVDAHAETGIEGELAARARLQIAHLWRRSDDLDRARDAYAELARDVRVGPRVRERARLGIASTDALQGLFPVAERTWIELAETARTPSVRVDAWLALARNERTTERSDRVRALLQQLLVNFERDALRGDERAAQARLRLQRHR